MSAIYSVSGLSEMYDGTHVTMDRVAAYVPFCHLICLSDAAATNSCSKTIM